MLETIHLTTEARNQSTMHLDDMSVDEFLTVMNEEDAKVAGAVKQELTTIRKMVLAAIRTFHQGGRLIYIGAGTSGRLGVLDAAECVPTFGTPPDMVVGVIAGGTEAIQLPVEGAEDNVLLAKVDLQRLNVGPRDMVIGLSASGRTPYVISGLRYARKNGAFTASIACNKGAEMSRYAQVSAEIDVGPEVLTGSTRLKAGTAQKMVLNMISTAAMAGIGKVFKNLMVDVQQTNEKLVQRSKRIIAEAAEIDLSLAEEYYMKAGGSVKKAIVMALLQCDETMAEERLNEAGGMVRQALM